jgi:predicted alpha/beta-hydrolase family hydrolase
LRNPDVQKIELEAGAVEALAYASSAAPLGAALILAHGAGAGQRSPFMVAFAQALAALGVDVLTFDFPYMEQRRRVPDRQPVLEACYAHAIAHAREAIPSARQHLFVGGKSMGGRIATHVAAADPAVPIDGLVLLGYPLHPPGRPNQLRDAHLKDVRRPMLVVQGERDAFGTPGELAPVFARLNPSPTMHVVERGDHSLKISRSEKGAQEAVYEAVQRRIVEWMRDVIKASPESGRRRG